jgi:hypothetical protein
MPVGVTSVPGTIYVHPVYKISGHLELPWNSRRSGEHLALHREQRKGKEYGSARRLSEPTNNPSYVGEDPF